MSGYAKQRALERITALAGQYLDLATFWRETSEALERAVPYYGGACWYTLDPTSLLITSHFNSTMPQIPPEWLAHEYYQDDFHKVADVARSERGVSTLHEMTDGDPNRSPSWNRYIHPYGGDQELLLALRTSADEA